MRSKYLSACTELLVKCSEYCNSTDDSANSVLEMIMRTITCKRKDTILKLYTALVRSKLEYCIQL